MFLYSGIEVDTAAEVYVDTNTKQQAVCLHQTDRVTRQPSNNIVSYPESWILSNLILLN